MRGRYQLGWAGGGLVAALALLAAGCRPAPEGGGPPSGRLAGAAPAARAPARAPSDGGPAVAATIFPLFDLLRRVAGERAEATLVLPPGASPHTFEPTPGAVRRLQGVAALFRIGHGLDTWAARLLPPGARDVVVDRGIPLRRGAPRSALDEGLPAGGPALPETGRRGGTGAPEGSPPGALDPHYYLAAAHGAAISRTLGETLAGLDPAGADGYRARAGALAAALARLDEELAARAAALPARRLATFHDAWRYFAEAYGFEIAAVFEPFPGRSPSPRWLRDFQRRVRAAGASVVFLEPQLAGAALAPVAADLGVGLGWLDPLGGVPGRESYEALLRYDFEQVAAAATATAAAAPETAR